MPLCLRQLPRKNFRRKRERTMATLGGAQNPKSLHSVATLSTHSVVPNVAPSAVLSSSRKPYVTEKQENPSWNVFMESNVRGTGIWCCRSTAGSPRFLRVEIVYTPRNAYFHRPKKGNRVSQMRMNNGCCANASVISDANLTANSFSCLGADTKSKKG